MIANKEFMGRVKVFPNTITHKEVLPFLLAYLIILIKVQHSDDAITDVILFEEQL